MDGVAEVNVSGAEQPALRVRVNPVALASMGLSMEDVRTAIANGNAIGPVGEFDGNERAIAISTNAQLDLIPQYEAIIVRSANGAVVRLSSVASVQAGVRNSRSAGWFNSQPSVLLVINKQSDRQRASRPWTTSMSCCRSSSDGYPRPSISRSCRTARRPSAPACGTCS